MDGKEDNEGRETLEADIPEASSEPAYVKGGVDPAKLVEAVLGKREDLLDPSQWPFAWQWWRRSPDAR